MEQEEQPGRRLAQPRKVNSKRKILGLTLPTTSVVILGLTPTKTTVCTSTAGSAAATNPAPTPSAARNFAGLTGAAGWGVRTGARSAARFCAMHVTISSGRRARCRGWYARSMRRSRTARGAAATNPAPTPSAAGNFTRLTGAAGWGVRTGARSAARFCAMHVTNSSGRRARCRGMEARGRKREGGSTGNARCSFAAKFAGPGNTR